MAQNVKEMTAEEIQAQIIRLGFDGDRERYVQFIDRLTAELPSGTVVALRGSVITNERWEDGTPFDSKGKGTSDLDVTLIGDEALKCWNEEGFYIPGLHTKPLGDTAPDIAPRLNPLREKLQAIAQRPVNIQATNNIILYARDVLLGQPYFVIVEAAT